MFSPRFPPTPLPQRKSSKSISRSKAGKAIQAKQSKAKLSRAKLSKAKL